MSIVEKKRRNFSQLKNKLLFSNHSGISFLLIECAEEMEGKT